MKRYNDIFFDLDDTLYDFSAAARESFKETYDLLDYNRFFDSFDRFMQIYEPRNKELWKLYGEGKISKSELNKERYNHPLLSVGINNPALADEFCNAALARIPTKNILIPGAIEILEYLKPKYNLHILSNGFKELQSKKMRTTGISGYFNQLILSDDIGINKPQPELFYYALKRANASVSKSIMIGDMFETDIAGAAGIGMEQIFFNRKQIKELPFAPTYEINSLEAIKDIL